VEKLKAAVNDKALKRWKHRYSCTLGEKDGWCDGVNARRCPMAIVCGRRVKDGSGCYLKI
jgi:hypothetical protein